MQANATSLPSTGPCLPTPHAVASEAQGPPSCSPLTPDAEDEEEEARGAPELGQKADRAGLGLQLSHVLLCVLGDGTHPL